MELSETRLLACEKYGHVQCKTKRGKRDRQNVSLQLGKGSGSRAARSKPKAVCCRDIVSVPLIS